MYIIYGSNIEHENMTLIVPIVILQAKATDRREPATERQKRSEGRDVAKVCYIEIRHMYDDIAYSKDDIGITEFIRIRRI